MRLNRKLPQVRKTLQDELGRRPDIDVTGAYIDAAIIRIQMGRGRSRFLIDDLRFGPIVDASAEHDVQQVAATSDAPVEAKLDLGRLSVNNRPCFPRIIPYHSERPADLAQMRFNIVWVPDYQDTALLNELAQAGLRGMAIPPRSSAPDGSPLAPDTAQLAPFGSETAPILFWYVGTRILPSAKEEMRHWTEQIRNADRSLKRPIMGDVAGLERAYSRQMQIDMLGASRGACHTTFGLRAYRDWLVERSKQAFPDTFFMTWIQTQPSPSVNEARRSADFSPLVVEPEQLRLQFYAALAAGYRGVGWWTHASLDDDAPGAVESKLMITQLNMEAELLEPWLATGSPVRQVHFSARPPGPRKLSSIELAPAADPKSPKNQTAEEKIRDARDQQAAREQLARDLEAVVLRVDSRAILVLPIWYDEEALFVPGQMTANDARIKVPDVGEAARAWEISTTRIEELRTERVAGGTEITLKKFDMTTAILFTPDEAIVQRLREQISQVAEGSAYVCMELSRAKYNRVVDVDRKLRAMQRVQSDSAYLLTEARSRLAQAEQNWKRRQFHESRSQSADAMQLLRILQHACWSEARPRRESPVASPHTLCYQTLPDHWDMLARHGRASHAGGPNLLRTGNFEDKVDVMAAEGWKHEQTDIPGVRAAAELYPQAHEGTYCLRLIATAATGLDPPSIINDRPVVVTTPPVTVSKGQLVSIRGWVKVAAPSLRNLEGALLYDSLGGPSLALRWRETTGWQKFDVVREVTQTGELTVTMALTGLGEVWFDELEIRPLDADTGPRSAGDPNAPPAKPVRGSPFEFWKNRIPSFRGKATP
jgi:hypothetical protein